VHNILSVCSSDHSTVAYIEAISSYIIIRGYVIVWQCDKAKNQTQGPNDMSVDISHYRTAKQWYNLIIVIQRQQLNSICG
jgi:hypothetical protein